MSRWLRTIGVLGMLLVAQASGAERLRLVGTEWSPFSDITLQNGGLATDIVSTALRRAGYDSVYEQVPWARAVLGVGEGRYDVLVTAWYNYERTHMGQYSQGYLINRIRFLKHKDSSATYRSLEQLRSYRIAVSRGYTYFPAFDNDPKLRKFPVHNFSMAVHMLAAGRVDLTLEDEYVARYNLAREPAEVREQIEFLPGLLTENSLNILVSLKNPRHAEIVAAFDREILAMKADGSYDELFRRHGL